MNTATENRASINLNNYERYRVSVEEYKRFRHDGFLVVRGLVSPEEIAELRRHTEDLMQGQLPEQQAHDGGEAELEAPPADLSPDEKAQFFLRIHMLHRHLELHERYLLHPRVLDVLECLIGPDVLAMQTMLFLKPPGKPGQGWHQDSFYIPTHPDTLCGASIAIDDCDERNGAIWFAKKSNVEPVYPPRAGYGFGTRELGDIASVSGVSDVDDEANELAPIADKYDQVLASAQAGDVIFFGGHVLHRSKQNWSSDRYRRSFVSHYSSARSFTQWGAAASYEGDPHISPSIDPVTGGTNGSHILARGDTHLPFASPRFGTPCAALLPAEERRAQGAIALCAMGDMDSDMMGVAPADPYADPNHDSNNGGY